MNDLQKTPTIEEGVNAMFSSVKERVRDRLVECERSIRRSPGKSILLAVGAGYLLHRLPVRYLIVSQVRLLAALTPPTMLAFGAAKLGEFLQGQCRERAKDPAPERSGEESRPGPVPFSGSF